MPASPRFQEFLNACFNDLALAARLLDDDPTLLTIPSGLHETPLHYLAIENALDAVRFLLSRGASPDPRNEFGNSPLQECVSICHAQYDLTAVIDMLLRAGADPYHFSTTNPCAWHFARGSGFPALQTLFAHLPPPSERHEDCDLIAPLPDDPEEPDDPE